MTPASRIPSQIGAMIRSILPKHFPAARGSDCAGGCGCAVLSSCLTGGCPPPKRASGAPPRSLRLLIAAALIPFAQPLAAAQVELGSSIATPAVGAGVILTLTATAIPASTSWNTFVLFDPAKVKLTAQTAPATGGFGTFIPDSRSLAAINASGQVRAGGYALGTGAAGGGGLGQFTFTTLAAGSTSLDSAVSAASQPFGEVFIKDAMLTIPTLVAPVTLTIGGSGPDRVLRMRTLTGFTWWMDGGPGGSQVQGQEQVFAPVERTATHVLVAVPTVPN